MYWFLADGFIAKKKLFSVSRVFIRVQIHKYPAPLEWSECLSHSSLSWPGYFKVHLSFYYIRGNIRWHYCVRPTKLRYTPIPSTAVTVYYSTVTLTFSTKLVSKRKPLKATNNKQTQHHSMLTTRCPCNNRALCERVQELLACVLLCLKPNKLP